MTDRILMKCRWSKSTTMIWRIRKDGQAYRDHGSGWNKYNNRTKSDIYSVIADNVYDNSNRSYSFYVNFALLNEVKE